MTAKMQFRMAVRLAVAIDAGSDPLDDRRSILHPPNHGSGTFSHGERTKTLVRRPDRHAPVHNGSCGPEDQWFGNSGRPWHGTPLIHPDNAESIARPTHQRCPGLDRNDRLGTWFVPGQSRCL